MQAKAWQNALFHGSSSPFFRCLGPLFVHFFLAPLRSAASNDERIIRSAQGRRVPFTASFPHPQHSQACAHSSPGSRGWREEGGAERRAWASKVACFLGRFASLDVIINSSACSCPHHTPPSSGACRQRQARGAAMVVAGRMPAAAAAAAAAASS